MARFLVIGFGNPLRSDDAVGWVVARRLSTELPGDAARVIAAHQLLPEMAEEVSRAERVVFVDATETGSAGDISEKLVEASSTRTDTHELSPAAILTLAQELYGKCPPAHLLTIAGETFETGEQLSASVTESIPRVIERIKALLREQA